MAKKKKKKNWKPPLQKEDKRKYQRNPRERITITEKKKKKQLETLAKEAPGAHEAEAKRTRVYGERSDDRESLIDLIDCIYTR